MSATAPKLFVDSLNQVDFDRSLPESYRAMFSATERAEHAAICGQRRAGALGVGLVPSCKAGQTAICINTEDATGLLALASAALATLGLEIQEAVAFGRTPAIGPREILDVFWLRDASKIIAERDVSAFANLFQEYLAGRSPEVGVPVQTRGSTPSGALVRFRDERKGTLSILEVETGDRFGLLWEVSMALTRTGVQIVASEIKTLAGRVTDTFTIEEQSGEAFSAARRLEVQTAVLTALES